MKKLIVFLIVVALGVLLIGNVSAAGWDNKLTYSKEDMKVELINWFGLGVNYGSAELTSHKSVNEIRNVGVGSDLAVMWYDFNFSKVYKKGLGKVYFTDKRTGEIAEKDYNFAYWGVKIVEDYSWSCSKYSHPNGTIYEDEPCEKSIVGSHEEEAWIDINSSDIPEGNIRIALITAMPVNNHYDAVWTIGGKKVSKHAEFSSWLKDNLVSCWTLDESSGTIIDYGLGQRNNGTLTGGTYGVPSPIASLGTGVFIPAGAANNISFTDHASLSFTSDFTIGVVFNTTSAVSPISKGHAAADEGYFSQISSGKIYWSVDQSDGTPAAILADTPITTGDVVQVLLTYDAGTNVEVYVNGTSDGISTTNIEASALNYASNIWIGVNPSGSSGAMYVYEAFALNYTVNDTDASDIWDSGNIISCGIADVLDVTSLFPASQGNYSTQSLYFTVNVSDSDSLGITNVSLLINGTINQTNATYFTGIYNFSVVMPDGFWNYTFEAYDNDTVIHTSTNGTLNFTVDTVPIINVTSPAANNTNYMTSTVYFNATSTFTIDYWIVNYNGTNHTLSGINTALDVEDGFFRLLLYANNSESGVFGLNDTIYFTVDTIDPSVEVSYPNETITFHQRYTNLTLDWTANDTNRDSCWYDYNGTNYSLTCNDNTTDFNITDVNNRYIVLYANDTLGRLGSDNVSWNYRLFLNDEEYDYFVIEGQSTLFTSSFITNGTGITIGNLSYNDTENIGTIADEGSNNYTVNRSIIVPSVSSSTNVSWFFNITQGIAGYYALASKQQEISPFGMDNCSNNTIHLYNFTIRDETSQGELSGAGNGTESEVDLQLYAFGTSNLIVQYNESWSQENPFQVCINNTLTTENYTIDVLVEYESGNHSIEFYNIQNETINSTNLYQNISLLDLNTSLAQSFKLIAKDSSFLALADGLIEVWRKYVDEGIYRVVEIPKTDGKGETVASLVVNDVIYRFVIKKFGVNVSVFNDVRAVCQNPTIETCSIDFTAFSSGITVPDYQAAEDFNFTLGYNNNSRVITSTFLIPSGTAATVLLNVTAEDALGTSVCSQTITSTSGNLNCSVPSNFGNATVIAKLYRDGSLQAQGQIKLDQNPVDIYGGVLVVLALFVMLSLIGAGMSDNPVFTIIFFMVGVIILFALNLVSSQGFIGATATILFLVVAIVILIIKAANRS